MELRTVQELAAAIGYPPKIILKQINEGQANKISKDKLLTKSDWGIIHDTLLVKTNLISQPEHKSYIAQQAGKPFDGKIKQNFPQFAPATDNDPDFNRKRTPAKKKAITNTKKTSKSVNSKKKERVRIYRPKSIIAELRGKTGVAKSIEKYQDVAPKRISDFAKKYYLTSTTLIDLLSQYCEGNSNSYNPNTALTSSELSIVQKFCEEWLKEMEPKHKKGSNKPVSKGIGRHLKANAKENNFKANYFKLIFIASGNKR